MRAHLDPAGKLIPPKSRLDGLDRMRLLERELARIADQLSDDARKNLFPSLDEYQAWVRSTHAARRYLQRETEQLRAWLDERTEQELLRRAHQLLVDLVEDGVDLEPDEQAVVDDIDKHLKGGAP